MTNETGWIRAADEEMTLAHLGVANQSDDYESAKKKLMELIQWHVDVSTDHRVNGGLVQVPLQEIREMHMAKDKRVTNWISVNDRLPENTNDVFAKTSEGYMVASYGQYGWVPSGATYATYTESGNCITFDGEVTHWTFIEDIK